jgi:xanthine/CO dehydrogenase XdhC/CoxF family maturation factor
MKDVLDILAAYHAMTQAGGRAALATVVGVTGSAYRRPGAKMLILEDGRTVGAISGGCLEGDVAEHARRAIAAAAPKLVTYDTRSEDDDAWGVGMGCNGEILVFIEPLVSDAPDNPLLLLNRFFQERREPFAVATVFRTSGGACAPGVRLIATADALPMPTPEFSLSASLADALRDVFAARKSRTETFIGGDARAEAFLEYVSPPPHLQIFGGGPDARPIVALAAELGWRVTVVDHRPAMAAPERFPTAEVVLSRYDDVATSAEDIALVMTHNYAHDREILRRLLARPPRYLGVLGPKRRTERILAELRLDGFVFAPETSANVYYPTGLDIGAETPQEIALSIVAEIQATLAGRAGARLRERGGPIH